MAQLAINGGNPVRPIGKPWPKWPIYGDTERQRIMQVLESGKWGGGSALEREFEQRFAEFNKTDFCIAACNGTLTILMALEALEIGAGDEVIVPGLTWQATAASVLDVNAIPVLVDIDPETYCIDLAKAEAAITPRTKAIIPVHLYGSMADMDGIRSLAKRYRLKIIEDCAHTHGSQWGGIGAGALGDIGSFSMQESKVLPVGEGGLLITKNYDLYRQLYILRSCGRLYPGENGQEGKPMQSGNYRMGAFQAAIGLSQLERLEAQTLQRDANAQYLNRKLAEIPGIKPMRRHAKVNRQAYYCYIFRYQESEFAEVPVALFRQALSAEVGIGFGSTYAPLTRDSLYQPHTKPRYHYSEEYWQAIDPKRFITPNSDWAYDHESIVMWHPPLLADTADMDDIVNSVAKLHENVSELAETAHARSKES